MLITNLLSVCLCETSLFDNELNAELILNNELHYKKIIQQLKCKKTL